MDSDGLDEINIFGYGFLSGYGANTYCRDGSNCKLFCANDGCQDLNLYCYSGSICILSPIQCLSIDVATIDINNIDNDISLSTEYNSATNGVICPNWYISSSIEDDKKLDDIIKYNKAKQPEQEKQAENKAILYNQNHNNYYNKMIDIKTINNNHDNNYSKQIWINVAVSLVTFIITFGFMYYYFNNKYSTKFIYNEYDSLLH